MQQQRITKVAVISLAAASVATPAFAAGLIVNEYNAVSDTNFIQFDPARSWEGYDHGAILAATAGSGNSTVTGRPRDGRIRANGANWIELVVTQDHLDIRNWKLEWSNTDPDQGVVTFNNNPLWSNLRSGTVITIIEEGIFTPTFDDGTTGAQINFDTNPSFNPQTNDWWINFDVDDVNYLTQSSFKVDNDNWQVAVKDGQGGTVFGPVGEAVINGWGGSGLGSDELAVFSADPATTSTPLDFEDNDYSTFGAPNKFNQFTQTQDFSALRNWWTNRLPGDANVDGIVNVTDFTILASNFNTTGHDWFGADFNNDGIVNVSDFSILAAHFNQTGPGPSGELTPQDWANLAAAVPEPSAAAGVAALVGMLAGRRRARRV